MDAFTRQLQGARPALLRTARARLRNPTWAEDAVSETLLAALEQRPSFDDPSRVNAWLFGVLRHKVVDQLRWQLGDASSPDRLAEEDQDLASMVDLHPRSDPVRRVADVQFVLALERNLAKLPLAQAKVFLMRECWGQATEEICRTLDISPVHSWVMLHRARRRLQVELIAHR